MTATGRFLALDPRLRAALGRALATGTRTAGFRQGANVRMWRVPAVLLPAPFRSAMAGPSDLDHDFNKINIGSFILHGAPISSMKSTFSGLAI